MLRVQGLLNEGEPTWGGVQFAYGGSGWLINRGFVRQLAAYLHEHAYTRPVDLLLHAYFGTMRRPVFASNATLFSHVGTVSTFPARRHEEYPSCGQVNSAMHFRNAFVPCPYQELASYLCDWPHASVLYQTHHAAAPPQPQPQQWMPPPQHPQQHPQQHQQWQQQQQHAGAGRAYGDKRPAPEGGGGEGNPYTYSPQQGARARPCAAAAPPLPDHSPPSAARPHAARAARSAPLPGTAAAAPGHDAPARHAPGRGAAAGATARRVLARGGCAGHVGRLGGVASTE